MKKLSMIALFLCFSLAFIVILPGCSKDPQDDSPVNPITPTITTNPVADKTVPVGSDDSISWETKDILSLTVSVNDSIVSKELKGSYKFDSVNVEKRVTFTGLDKNNEPINPKMIRFMPQSSHPKPTISLTSNPVRLPQSGGLVTVNWETTNAQSVLHNNVSYPPNGSVSYNVNDTTTFSFTAIGLGGQTTKSITVDVEAVINPPLTYMDYACGGSWKQVQFLYTCEALGIYDEEIDITSECSQDNRIIFDRNGICAFIFGPIYCEGGITHDYNFSYVISNDTIFGLGDPRQIISLDSDTLIWRFYGIHILPDNTGTPTIITEKFIHP